MKFKSNIELQSGLKDSSGALGTSGQVLSTTGTATSWTTLTTGGTVSSVAQSHAGNAFSVTGSPITNSGTLTISMVGNAGQYINGAGNLTTFPTIPTNNSQLTNGAGYITSYINTTYTAGTGLSLTGTVFANTAPNIVQTTVSGNAGTVTNGVYTTTVQGLITNNTQVLANTAKTSNIVQTTVSGNAGSATVLQTARTIAGVSFNGSANISLNNNAITNGAGYITSGSLSPYLPLSGGTMTGNVTANSGVGFQYGSTHWLVPRDNSNNLHIKAASGGIYLDGGVINLRNAGGGAGATYSAGNFQVSASSRAPIFYDSNNTAYYTDPAGTSNMNVVTAVTFNGTLNGNVNGTASAATTATTATTASNVGGVTTSQIVYGGAGRKSTQNSVFSSNTEASGFYYGTGMTGAPTTDYANYIQSAGNSWQSGNNYSFQLTHAFHSDNFWVSRMTNGTASTARLVLDAGGGHQTKSGILQSNSSLRAPIFYDSNNTTYYTEPASTSNMNVGNFASVYGTLHVRIGSQPQSNIGLNLGTDSSIYMLQSTYSSGAYYKVVNDTGTPLRVRHQVSSFDTTAYTDSIVIFNHNYWRGYVGILRSPEYPLDLNGQARLTGGYTTSDVRLKENIRDNELGLTELLQLKTKVFDWITDREILGRTLAFQSSLMNCRGFIAQEAELVAPELVDTSEGDEPTKSIDEGAVTAMLVKAIQEQQVMIEDLKSRLETLENK